MLDMEAGDLEGAIRGLNAQLARDPKDAFSLRLRADAYQQMGEFGKAQVDRDRLDELLRSRRASAARTP